MAVSSSSLLLRRGATGGAGRRWGPGEALRRLVSSSEAAPAEKVPARSPPVMPPFEHRPRPYAGWSGDEILAKRKQFLGSSVFYYYQKPVQTLIRSYLFPLFFLFTNKLMCLNALKNNLFFFF